MITSFYYDTPNGKITKDIFFERDKVKVFVKAGTPAVIDIKEGIALVNGVHFFVYNGEYEIFYN